MPRNTSHPDMAWAAFRASLPLQLGRVEVWPLCTRCLFSLCIQHRCGKLTAIAPEKNIVRFRSVWDFVDENMGATGPGAIFLASVL